MESMARVLFPMAEKDQYASMAGGFPDGEEGQILRKQLSAVLDLMSKFRAVKDFTSGQTFATAQTGAHPYEPLVVRLGTGSI